MYLFVTRHVIDKNDIPEIMGILHVLGLNSVYITF